LATLDGFSDKSSAQAFLRAQELNAVERSPKAQIRILVGLWIHTWVSGALSESLEYARELKQIADRAARPSLSLQGEAGVGQVLMHLGKISEAREYLVRGLDCIADSPPKTLPEQNAATSCAAYAAWCSSMLGEQSAMRRFYRASKGFAEIQPNPYAMAIHYALSAESFMVDDDVQSCCKYAEKAVDVSREHNFNHWLGTGLVMRGWALGHDGKIDASLLSFDEGIAVYESTGAIVQLSNWNGLKAEILLLAERYKEAICTAELALDFAAKTSDQYFTPRIHAVCAEAYRVLDEHEQYEYHSSKARSLTEAFGMDARVYLLRHAKKTLIQTSPS
jgi:tetratricopeptide (TPR) repeat protein